MPDKHGERRHQHWPHVREVATVVGSRRKQLRIIDIREQTVSIAAPIANAYIDFSKMTCSVVAVSTDVVRDGRTVVGFGFNSNGRYGQGALLRERFLPRLTAAAADSLPNVLAHDADGRGKMSRI
jgi:hypothetical protein